MLFFFWCLLPGRWDLLSGRGLIIFCYLMDLRIGCWLAGFAGLGCWVLAGWMMEEVASYPVAVLGTFTRGTVRLALVP